MAIFPSIFLIISLLGFIIGLLIVKKSHTNSSNVFIGLLALGFSVVILQYVFHWSGLKRRYTFLYFFDHSIYLTFGPLLYSYILKFYKRAFKLSIVHYFPALASFILNVLYYDVSSTASPMDIYNGDTLFHFYFVLRSPWIAAVSFLIYFIVLKEFVQFNAKTEQNQYEKIRNRWVHILLNLFSIFIVAYLSYFILVKFSFFNYSWDYAISLSMSISIYAIGYFVYKQPEIFNGELLKNIFDPVKVNTLQIPDNIIEDVYHKLTDHFKSNKPYLINDLRLVHLADDLNIQRHILSKVINEKTGSNFNQFVNNFRLKEAERLIINKSSESIKSIYFEVGFNSKASFYKAFKNKHNCSPSAYKERIINNS